MEEKLKEIWKDIPNYEGLYQISNLGNIMSIRRKRLIKSDKRKDGYIQVHLTKNKKMKNFLLHRLVAITFIENSNNYEFINHIDGNKENNSLNNLEWCDRSYNILHAYDNELIKKRKKVEQYDKNNNLLNIYRSIMEASKKTNIDRAHISACCKGKKKYKSAGGYIWRYVYEK